jgi:type I restriction-modification system DNA methylase subunit
MILVEMKSKGKSLDKAHAQAKDYMHGLKEYELPKFILVSDFDRFRLYDLEENKTIEFKLDELYKHVQHFGYLLGYQKRVYKEQDPANIKAAELMGKLHDRLEEIGYAGHPLEVYLVRILFCLFAEDTTIFNKQQFQDYIEQRTNLDGSDLAPKLQQLFQVLNTPKESRYKNLDEQLADFPYVNGKLFEETLPVASFDRKMREALLDCCYIDWSKISPAIFGSMFQSVMNPEERRNLGAHYTSEKNILKLIKPLFLDELRAEFESIKDNKNKLPEFHRKLGDLKFLDPACGCGNFLVITYRELRLLEFDVLKALVKSGQKFLDISQILWVEVDQFAGIEFEEFPSRIAEVAMWLIDHQMNMMVSNEFGQYYVRLPLRKSAKIVNADALEINWEDIVAQKELSFIIGNPPFIGSKLMKQNQRDQIVRLFNFADGSGTLDYVSGWYLKAAEYIQGTSVKVAFVSTNSIVQGEQVSILWGVLLEKYKIRINFAHRTFKWGNEAAGNAAVYCVIVGYAVTESIIKKIYEYENVNGEAHEVRVKRINPYLVDSKDILIGKKSLPICNVPRMSFGNMPLDGGNLLLTESEKLELIEKEPLISKFILPLISASEFLNGGKRWCLWLVGADPAELKQSRSILERVQKVKEFRLASKAPSTQKFASTPTLFRDRNRPSTFIVIPRVSSENRTYIPMGFFDQNSIVSDTCMAIPNGEIYHFGVLMSFMHMAWVKSVCGRLESRFRYSKDIVYNNFPWPESPGLKQVERIERAAQNVLDIRLEFPNSSLADLYHALTMPPALVKAHEELDKAVDNAYRPQPFVSEANRMVFLFELYEKYTADLFTDVKSRKKKKNEL